MTTSLTDKERLYMVFDVEAIGLHGEGFAAGYVVINGEGEIYESFLSACFPGLAKGKPSDREWVEKNVPSFPYIRKSVQEVRNSFWTRWMEWKAQGAFLVADCAWPVEARFLAAAVDDNPAARLWEGPYPLHDLASILLALGEDPLATTERLPDELPAHNPLNDALHSARQLIAALKKAKHVSNKN